MSNIKNSPVKVITTSTDQSQLANIIIKNNLKYKNKIAVLERSLDNLETAKRIIKISTSTKELHDAFDNDLIFKLLDETYSLYLNAYDQFELIGTGWYQLCNIKNRPDLINELNNYGNIVKASVKERPHMVDIKESIWEFDKAVDVKAYTYLANAIITDLTDIKNKYINILNQYNDFANNQLLDVRFIINLALSK